MNPSPLLLIPIRTLVKLKEMLGYEGDVAEDQKLVCCCALIATKQFTTNAMQLFAASNNHSKEQQLRKRIVLSILLGKY